MSTSKTKIAMMQSLFLVSAMMGFAFGFQSPSPSLSHGFVLNGSIRYASRTAPTFTDKVPKTLLHSNVLAGIDEFWTNSPYAVAALVCGVKASAADGMAQFQEWKNSRSDKEEKEVPPGLAADFRRNAAFIIYGSLYQGITQEFLFNHVYTMLFGKGNKWAVVLSKVSFTLLVLTPLLTFPSLYLIKAVVEENSFRDSLKKYINDIKNNQLLQKFYLLWTPVLTLTFSVIPEQWRVTFIAFVSFFWLIILSRISSGATPAEKD